MMKDDADRSLFQDDMREDDIVSLNQAFDLLAAPDRTYERVMDMTGENRGAHASQQHVSTHRMTRRAFVACAALSVAAIGTVAYAAVNTDFFRTAFGDKGQPDIEAHEVNRGDGTTYTLPSRQWVGIDSDDAERLLGGYVEYIGDSIAHEGYVLTLCSCVVDENGLGVASFELCNPDGVQIVKNISYEYGEIEFDEDCPVGAIAVTDATGMKPVNGNCLFDRDVSSDTDVVGASYFDIGRSDGTTTEQGVSWTLAHGNGYGAPGELDLISFHPSKLIPTRPFISQDEDVTASISPIGMVIDTPNDSGCEFEVEIEATGETVIARHPEWMTTTVRIVFVDGTEYVVRDTGVSNTAFGLVADDFSSQSMIFNRLVDPERVASIVVNGFNPGDPDVVFLPEA